MRFGKIYFLILFIYFFHYPDAAVSQQKHLDLQELMEIALKKNADIQVQRNEKRIAKYRWWQSVSQMFPRADVEAGVIKSSARNGTPDFVAANALFERNAWLSLQQPIFNADNVMNILNNHIEQQKQELLYSQAMQDVLLQVVEAYFTALQNRDDITVYKKNLDAFKILYDQSKFLYENGVVPELDVKKSRVEYLLQKNMLLKAQKDYLAALNHIKELTGFAIEDSLALADISIKTTHLDSLPAYLKIALKNRPELKAAELEKKRFAYRKRFIRLRHLPSANAGVYYGWDTAEPIRSVNKGWQVYLTLRMPLWHWGSIHLDQQIAGIRYQQTEALYRRLLKQIKQQVINSYRECKIQLQQMQAMQESEQDATEAVRMAKIGYQEGTVTNLDVINTQKLLTETQVKYYQALYAFYVAKARLYRSMGKLKEDFSWLE
ncbi:MAG: TolC family protein [Actinobacteria bacterium]|nr:TolC family protein [Actinomycetota bacterium]